MINDQGGINGRKINLISLDDAFSPPKTVEQTRRLFKTSAHSGDDIEYQVQPDDSGPAEHWYKDVWSIRTKLQVEERTEELAMFNLTIDSTLRGCSVRRLKMWPPHA
jgi:hypothetical protein